MIKLRKTATTPTDQGQLQINVTSAANRFPIDNATIAISDTFEPDQTLEEVTTNSSGQSPLLTLSAPPLDYSMEAGSPRPYTEYTLRVTAPGFEPVLVTGTEVLPNVLAVQPIQMRPLDLGPSPSDDILIPDHTLYGDYPPKIAEPEIKPLGEDGEIVLSRVVVPETIVVHDGAPNNASARNYYVPYKDYIKNVASSEIYATWPEATITANVLAILSFTMNRVYTEFYRNRGYDFTITSSTAYDHKWIYGRNIYEDISRIVDDIFTDYLSRPDVKQPILTQYCDGKRVTCPNWMTKPQERINFLQSFLYKCLSLKKRVLVHKETQKSQLDHLRDSTEMTCRLFLFVIIQLLFAMERDTANISSFSLQINLRAVANLT